MTGHDAEGDPRIPILRRFRLLLHLTWEDGDADAFVREVSATSLHLEMGAAPAGGTEVRFEGQIPLGIVTGHILLPR